MPDPDSGPEEAITKDEIRGEEPPKPKPRNAFTELMSTKRKHSPGPPPPQRSRGNPFRDRMGLGAYLEDPTAYPPSRVIYHTDDFVVINDKFPKALIHTLLLPRSPKHNLQHPFDAFNDVEFLAKVKTEVANLKKLVAKELQRKLGAYSKSDAARQAVLNGDVEPEDGELPRGRDWEAEVVCGVHAVPSMTHLHVHVLSRDMHSECVKHRKHYNSFNTPFLVNLEDFPLDADDPRRETKKEGYLQCYFRCWRCGKDFGHKFKQLKQHLDDEFEEWKRL
ncbi:Fc.00g052560.m01.CDS01 [Cosmosporella sp. VM-42]